MSHGSLMPTAAALVSQPSLTGSFARPESRRAISLAPMIEQLLSQGTGEARPIPPSA